MFAVFFTPEMDRFYQIVATLPTVLFSFFLLLMVLYWLLAALGLADLDILNVEASDIGPDLAAADDLSHLNVFSGLLFKLGLHGVPFTIVLTFVALFGWVLSFLGVYLLEPFVPGALLEFILGCAIFVGALYTAALFTGWVIRPMRPLFRAASQEYKKQVLGQTAVVRTGEVNATFGEATLADGGAGLIIKVRPYKDEAFKRGDRVVLLEYVAEEHIYKVIAETEFKN